MKSSVLHTILLAGITMLVMLCPVVADAEVVYLKSGQHVEGTIIFQNEEVVVLKDATGARYQYVMSDVDHVAAELEQKEEVKETATTREKRVDVGVSVAGGGTFITKEYVGGAVSANLSVGTANLLDRRIFLGGAVGYNAAIMPGKGNTHQLWSFIPLQLRAEVPMMQTAHAPMVGLGVGYGISATKNIEGGFYAETQLGWRYQMNDRNHLFLGAYCAFQNAKVNGLQESIDDVVYSDNSNHTFVSFGLKATFYL